MVRNSRRKCLRRLLAAFLPILCSAVFTAQAMAVGVWFRKCLRLHDNAPLVEAVARGGKVVPFFILDPSFDRSKIGVNRYNFLLESLSDLDEQLRVGHGSRLLVFQGTPDEVFKDLFNGKGAITLKSLFWEHDTEPYSRLRDAKVVELAKDCGVATASFQGHTLLNIDNIVKQKGFKPPIAMKSMEALLRADGLVKDPLPVPKIPPLDVEGYAVPSITSLYSEQPSSKGFPGGEREALRRLEAVCSDADYICMFEKPKTSSTGTPRSPLEPSTTGLSPYLKFGCLSVRQAWHAFAKVQVGRSHSQPPQSLHGQLLFREMFYLLGAAVPNFDKAEGNAMCKEIPWDSNGAMISAWEEGRTGYPFIDALMRQLKQTGWMHHLGRHAVACFLTRGDLWQHWTAGRDIFDKLLLDADWALNNGNWLWLAGVAPFSAPYFRIYDPCPGPKSSLNAEQTGEFAKAYVPELKNFPAKYIYKPWTAPLEVQKKAGCIIGQDYPRPIVEHSKAREANLARFKAGLEALQAGRLPEKLRHGDPGPMVNAKIVEGAAESGKGKGKGRIWAALKGSKREEPSPEAPAPKLRRWGNSSGAQSLSGKAAGG